MGRILSDAIEFYLRETKFYDDVSSYEKERLEYLTFSFRGEDLERLKS